jgi:hypothetical protein
MQPSSFYSRRLLLTGALIAGVAACGGQHGGPSALPEAGSPAGPMAAATPPVTAPVTIPYPYTNVSTTTTWKSATAAPKKTSNTETGKIVVQFALDSKTGVYLVPETIKSDAGYTEVLNSAITFPALKKGTAQIILSDNYTYVQKPLTETGLDTYPQTQNSFDFPLTKGRRWSAAAAHVSSDNVAQTGSGAVSEIDASNVAANGEYTGQTSFSSTNGSANQDNYASTTSVSATDPSVFTLAEPAAGFNMLTQTFGVPAAKKPIVVSSKGKKPIPFKSGNVRVPNWYPGGTLPKALYSDDYVVTGPISMPSQCGKKWNGKPSTAVTETYYDLDPVEGEYDVNTTAYYLTTLATGQYWFACIVEAYTNTTYANGWVSAAGNWGTPSSQTTGTEILLATGATPTAHDLAGIRGLHVLSLVPPVASRQRLMHLGARRPQ